MTSFLFKTLLKPSSLAGDPFRDMRCSSLIRAVGNQTIPRHGAP